MFRGSIVALITPFTQDEEKVDEEAIRRLIQWHIEEGTEALVLGGSTGEGSLLSFEEKRQIFQIGVEEGKGKIGLIASLGFSSTKENVWLGETAKKLGMDASLALIPPYVKPSLEGLILHMNEVSKTGLPMILYYHPGRTGTKLSAASLAKLCSLSSVVGIKDSSGDLGVMMSLVKEHQIPFFSGEDSHAFAHLALGATGTISVLGNVLPKLWKEMVDISLEGNLKKGQELFFSLYDLLQAMEAEVNPQCIKYAVSLLGKCQNSFRLPLIKPKRETQEKIAAALALFLPVSPCV